MEGDAHSNVEGAFNKNFVLLQYTLYHSPCTKEERKTNMGISYNNQLHDICVSVKTLIQNTKLPRATLESGTDVPAGN